MNQKVEEPKKEETKEEAKAPQTPKDALYNNLLAMDEKARLNKLAELIVHQGIIINVLLKHVPLAELEVVKQMLSG